MQGAEAIVRQAVISLGEGDAEDTVEDLERARLYGAPDKGLAPPPGAKVAG